MTRLCNKLGIRSHLVTKQSKHLEYSHPSMENIRVFVGECSRSQGVHKRLIGHFDQVCTVHYQHSRKVLFKSPDQAGQFPQTLLSSEKKALAAITAALNLPDLEKGASAAASTRKAELNAAGHQVPVDQARVARTTTTLSWSDGELGRSFVTMKSGTIDSKILERLNEELKSTMQISTHDPWFQSSVESLLYLSAICIHMKMVLWFSSCQMNTTSNIQVFW